MASRAVVVRAVADFVSSVYLGVLISRFFWVKVWIYIAWVLRSEFPFSIVALDPGSPGIGFGAGGLSSSKNRFCEAFDGFGP